MRILTSLLVAALFLGASFHLNAADKAKAKDSDEIFLDDASAFDDTDLKESDEDFSKPDDMSLLSSDPEPAPAPKPEKKP